MAREKEINSRLVDQIVKTYKDYLETNKGDMDSLAERIEAEMKISSHPLEAGIAWLIIQNMVVGAKAYAKCSDDEFLDFILRSSAQTFGIVALSCARESEISANNN